MHAWLVVHAPPAPGAPEPLTTLVSPAEPGAADMALVAMAGHMEPVIGVRRHFLDYPEMPPDPVVGVEMVRARYRDCARCHLCASRNNIVHVRGNLYSPVVAIGEGPGRDEDMRGIPFVGRSGRLQDELFREAGIDPEKDIAWLNAVGCRPCASRFTGDRPPTLVEKIACSERTLMLLRSLRPRVVLLLGQAATTMFFAEPPPIYRWLGPLTPPDDPRDWILVAHIPHPAGLLRAIGGEHFYGKYKTGVLFYRALKAALPGWQKVARWRFGLHYLNGTVAAAGKAEDGA